MEENVKYNWTYCSIGGVTRVVLGSGEDIAHIGELDQKLWTVLSCPVKGLEFDSKTLSYIDSDADGKIKVNEVVNAAQWLTRAVKNKDLILKGESTIALDAFNTDDELGSKLHDSALHILKNLGAERDSISIADTADSIAIFKNTVFNGDGIITPASAEAEGTQATIKAAIDTVGSVQDRNGEAGINADILGKFYDACAKYSAWQQAAADGKDNILPYGDDTAAALDACNALKAKIADFYMRCKLVNYNEVCTGAVDVSAEKIGNIADKNLADCTAQIADYPLAKPGKDGILKYSAINPAWQNAFAKLRSLVLDKEYAEADGIDEQQWTAVLGKFEAYSKWLSEAAGCEVAALGLDKINEILKADEKAAIAELIAKDEALKAESEAIDDVDKFLHLYRDFYVFLRNYITFSDLYDPDCKAIFQAGELYIDQRCCKLCIKVDDMGKHGDMAGLSGMFLIYCTCTSKTRNATMDIVAVMTDGGTRNLRPGLNAIFYDRDGGDWDATVTKIVDNPISIKQAFWSPYIKFANFVSDKINKSASEKEGKVMADMQAKADATPASLDEAKNATAKKAQSFDIAKFAGIFAAIGMALGYIGSFLTTLAKGATANPLGLVICIVVIMLCISGPSCFIAWGKLRKRNLGPVLNANGWAINSNVLVNIIFGGTLTSIAKYPLVKGKDPYVKETPLWKKVLRWVIVLVILAFGVMFLTNNLKWMGIERKAKAPAQTETVAENVPAEEAPAAEVEAAAE